MLRTLLLALAGAAIAAATANAEPKVTDFELENGMRAVVIEDHRAPVVTHMVWYKVGSADEPDGQTGVAHFLEHLMFKGTGKIASGDFSKIVAANGGQDNAFTSRDYTAYFQRIAKDRLGLVMEMEADRMRNLVIAPEEVDAERAVVIEERNMRTDNEPSARFREQFTAALYMNHGYGEPVIGWRHELEKLNREDALDFYQRFYAPNNATLIVAGDVTPEEVRTLAERHYGPIAAVDLPEHSRSQEPPHLAERRLRMSDPRVAQPMVQRIYLAPSVNTGEGNESAALDILADILGGGSTRRFQRLLTQETDLAVYAGAYYWGDVKDDGEFGIYAAPKGETTLAEVEGALDWIVADLLRNGVTEAEVARAKKSAIAGGVYAQDSQTTLARYYGSGLTIGLDVEFLKNWRERIEAVTTEDVMNAARKVFRPERSVTGWLETATAPEGESG